MQDLMSGTSSARGIWRHVVVEEEPMAGAARRSAWGCGCGQKGRAAAPCELTPGRHLCRAHSSTRQGWMCTSTGECIQLNIFIDAWYPVGLPGVHSTGGTCANHS